MVAAPHLVVAAYREIGHLSNCLEIHDKLKNPIFWDITPCSLLKSIDVLEEYLAYIFSVEEWTKQETSTKL
jgi:hypothetical protein